METNRVTSGSSRRWVRTFGVNVISNRRYEAEMERLATAERARRRLFEENLRLRNEAVIEEQTHQVHLDQIKELEREAKELRAQLEEARGVCNCKEYDFHPLPERVR